MWLPLPGRPRNSHWYEHTDSPDLKGPAIRRSTLLTSMRRFVPAAPGRFGDIEIQRTAAPERPLWQAGKPYLGEGVHAPLADARIKARQGRRSSHSAANGAADG